MNDRHRLADNIPIELTVISGRHADAVVPLTIGSVLLGSSDHCDIVLTDDNIDNEHLLITVATTGIRVHCLGASVRANESEIIHGSAAPIALGTGLTIGDAQIGIAKAGTSWTTFESDEQETDGADLTAVGATSPIKRLPVIAGIVGLAIVAIFGVSLVTASVLNRSAIPKPMSVEQRFHDLQQRVGQLNLPEVFVLKTQTGLAQVNGYVSDQNQLQQLKAATSDLNPQLSVFNAAELVRYATDMVRAKSLDAEITYVRKGTLHLEGRDDADGSLQTMAATILNEIPGVEKVSRDIEPLAAADPPPIVLKPEEEHFMTGVARINAGHPIRYMVIGDNYVFEGGVLKNGMSVLSIGEETVVVDDRGSRKTKEVKLR